MLGTRLSPYPDSCRAGSGAASDSRPAWNGPGRPGRGACRGRHVPWDTLPLDGQLAQCEAEKEGLRGVCGGCGERLALSGMRSEVMEGSRCALSRTMHTSHPGSDTRTCHRALSPRAGAWVPCPSPQAPSFSFQLSREQFSNLPKCGKSTVTPVGRAKLPTFVPQAESPPMDSV